MQLRLVVALVSILLLIAGLVYADHRGHERGVTERDAYYESQLLAAQRAKDAADKRASDTQLAAQRAALDVENSHAAEIETLNDRYSVANQRIAGLVRHVRHESCGGGQQLPAVTGSPGPAPGAAASDERDRGFSQRVAAVGRSCEHDADEVTQFLRYYERLNTLFNHQGTAP